MESIAYAQRAAVIGAKNYLLKRGLSKEQILQSCKAVYEEIERDWLEEDRLDRHLDLNRQEDRAYRGRTIKRVIDGTASSAIENMRSIKNG